MFKKHKTKQPDLEFNQTGSARLQFRLSSSFLGTRAQRGTHHFQSSIHASDVNMDMLQGLSRSSWKCLLTFRPPEPIMPYYKQTDEDVQYQWTIPPLPPFVHTQAGAQTHTETSMQWSMCTCTHRNKHTQTHT